MVSQAGLPHHRGNLRILKELCFRRDGHPTARARFLDGSTAGFAVGVRIRHCPETGGKAIGPVLVVTLVGKGDPASAQSVPRPLQRAAAGEENVEVAGPVFLVTKESVHSYWRSPDPSSPCGRR